MLQLIGRSAHSSFRLNKLLNTLQEQLASVKGLRSEYRYFIELDGKNELSASDEAVAETLLEATKTDALAYGFSGPSWCRIKRA